ncbi:DNA excision repair protein ERCC-1-like [Chenopodium quinoa]|uniref:DNA excision repair protein ERCC-1-like n=1 Tax=Chenopodium quinoa TaxID=63459 RepID=UPI000B795354|nr:DNA excision repair protein ERCC-1-like [Chenopodium quinoa]XP_021772997.1 DNA excision repair protein ERCC-1-like [Chenopodium quinoa]
MEENPEEPQNQRKKSSIVIEIPSYQEVLQNNQLKSTQPSLFTPSQSFTQAFASIKKSEFYTPPPAPPPSTFNSQSLSSSNASSSASASALPSSSGQTGVSNNNIVQKSNAIIVSHRQKGNPLLKHIRNVRWNFAEVIPDYVLGQNSCCLYLSLRYHLLHPDYLYFRIRELQKNFRLRVVLCHVDVEDVVKPLLEVTRTCLLHDCTLLCAWSLEECGRYLETIKVFENKPADIIQGHMDSDYLSRLNHALTAVRHVNKTDVVTLGSTFGSLSHIIDASMEDLARCPGIGERKVKRLYDTFHEPFKRVVPNRSEAPLQNDPTPTSLESEPPAVDKESEDTSKRQKKDPEVILKSALSAAFAKYSDKLGKKSTPSDKESGEGSNIQKESEADSEI